MPIRSLSLIIFSLMTLLAMPPAQTDTFQIGYGDTISDGVPAAGAGNIEVGGAQDVYEFSVTSGDEVILDWLVGSTGLFRWMMTAPDGTELFDSINVDQQLTLTQTGTYTLAVRANIATTTGTYSFRLLTVPPPQEFAINIGDTVSGGVPAAGAGNLEVPGAIDVFIFTGTAGQEIIFDWLSGSNVQIRWMLQAPDATELFEGPLADQQLILPQTGTYSLTLRGSTIAGTGMYSFRILTAPAPQEFSIAIGDTVSNGVPAAGAGNIEVPGSRDVYSFDGTAGVELVLDWQSGSNVQLRWALQAPDATVLFDGHLADQQLILPQTGTYTLTLRGSSIAGIGTYSFQIQSVATTQAFTIAIGDTVSDGVPAPGAGNIEGPGSLDVYSFEATAGEAIIFDWLSGSNGLIGWILQAPDGTILYDSFLSDQQFTLLQTGTYLLTLHGNNPDDVGTYSFQLLVAPSTADQFTIAIGDTVSDGIPGAGAGNLEVPGAIDIYNFEGLSGEGVLFDWLTGNNGLIGWRLEAPDATVLFDTFLLDRPVVLPQTGTYTLTVRGNSPDDFGVYSFTLLEGIPNNDPVANNDMATTDEDVPVTVNVLANDTDVDGDSLSVDSVSQPASGSTAVNADETITYTPNAGFSGSDSFSYTAADGNGGSDSATVTITVTAAIVYLPVTVDDTFDTDEDTALIVDAAGGVLANDSHPAGAALSAKLSSDPEHGSLTLNSDGSLAYQPNSDFHGIDSFTYMAVDGSGGEATATTLITVISVNDDPVAEDDDADTPQNAPVEIDVLANDSDVDGDLLTIDSVDQPNHGSVMVNSDDTVTYTPETGYVGNDDFVYDVSDGAGGLASANVTVTVTPLNGQVVGIDILPFISLNLINLNSRAKLPVAILSDSTFDARDVAVDSVLFAGATAVPPLPWGPDHFVLDVSGDGLKDLVVYFNIQDLNLPPSNTEAMLTGETLAGVAFNGTDSVHIIPLRAPKLVKPRDGFLVKIDRPLFRWYPVAVNTCYQIQLNDAAFVSDDQTVLRESTVEFRTYYRAQDLPDGRYYWRVRVGGNCQIHSGPWSNVRTFEIKTR